MNSNNDKDKDDSDLFRAFMNDVAPLKSHTVEPVQNKPQARIKKRTILKTSNSLVNNKGQHDSDSFFASHLTKKTRTNLKAGNVCFDATLDLHGQTVLQSEQLLAQFINDCQHRHIKYAIIIHGQGHNSEHGSVLKPAVLYCLFQQEMIEAYCPAQARDGGNGATYVLISGY